MIEDSVVRRPRVAVTHDAGYNVDAYLESVERAGGEAVAVAPGGETSMRGFDALVISGGVDVNPALYGQEPAPETELPDDSRDQMEQAMLREALAEDKPVLAICRGLQLFNVFHGGTLLQDIEQHRTRSADKSIPAHRVRVTPGSRLAGLLEAIEAPVNSRHHQAVGKVGAGIAVTAVAPDGIVEGLERGDLKFAVAVQWHPENMTGSDPAQLRLFEGLIAAARAAAS